ncbi:FHA domain-containing protein [candidate division KSB1 bacterium]|nr:FHA domain-containing protein [candidate division KSB1 bacterium]
MSFWPPKIGPRPLTDGNKKEKPKNDPIDSISIYDSAIRKTEMVPVAQNWLKLDSSPIGLLYTESGKSQGACFLITEEMRTMTFGRHESCDICIPDSLFSRMQFRINILPIDSVKTSQRMYKFEICDSQSSNGTSVNGKKITQIPLKDSDLIQAGGTKIRFLELNKN